MSRSVIDHDLLKTKKHEKNEKRQECDTICITRPGV